MTLYKPTDQSGQPLNTVYAEDVAQLVNVLTGQADGGSLTLLAPVADPTAFTPGITLSAGALTGAYKWAFYWITGIMDGTNTAHVAGRTLMSTPTATQNPSAQQATVSISGVTVPTGVIGWGVCRTKAGGSTYYLVPGSEQFLTIAGTMPATFVDNVPDGSLVTAVQSVNNTGTFLGASALAKAPVLETGVAGQIRAGRSFSAADFTSLLGLSAPVAIYNLADLTDASGNGHTLTNKGAVTFGSGITGQTTEAAIFHGGTTDALYLADAGAGDPFRLQTFSIGCWFRTAKTGLRQTLISKMAATGAAADSWFWMEVTAANVLMTLAPLQSGSVTATGVTNVCDDRWHFGVMTYDGTTLCLYLDGALEATALNVSALSTANNGPLNIGAYQTDGTHTALLPSYGRIDAAFLTADVLTLDQVRALYAAKVAHGYGAVPPGFRLNVRRRRKGGAIPAGAFSTTPLHLYNFAAGALTDSGSLNTSLTNNGAAISVAGMDGAQGNAFNFVAGSSQSLSASDAGLPAGTTARTAGYWIKQAQLGAFCILNYGTTLNTNDFLMGTNSLGQPYVQLGNGTNVNSPVAITDGLWHFVVAVIDPSASDGLLQKLYVDGKLAAASTAALVATVLGGASKFRLGSSITPSNYLSGQLDAAFLTGYAMSGDEVAKIYAQGVVSEGPSPKNPGDHIEAVDASNVYVVLDTIDSQHQVDLVVTP